MPGIDLSLSRTLKTEQPAYQDAELKVCSCGVITSCACSACLQSYLLHTQPRQPSKS